MCSPCSWPESNRLVQPDIRLLGSGSLLRHESTVAVTHEPNYNASTASLTVGFQGHVSYCKAFNALICLVSSSSGSVIASWEMLLLPISAQLANQFACLRKTESCRGPSPCFEKTVTPLLLGLLSTSSWKIEIRPATLLTTTYEIHF